MQYMDRVWVKRHRNKGSTSQLALDAWRDAVVREPRIRERLRSALASATGGGSRSGGVSGSGGGGGGTSDGGAVAAGDGGDGDGNTDLLRSIREASLPRSKGGPLKRRRGLLALSRCATECAAERVPCISIGRQHRQAQHRPHHLHLKNWCIILNFELKKKTKRADCYAAGVEPA